MRKNFCLLIIFLCVQIHGVTAYQNEKQTQNKEDYQVLADKFYEHLKDSLQAKSYATTYLQQAKKDADTIRIADGFYFLSLISESEDSNKYSDSIITIVKNKPTEYYPTYAYLNKAALYYKKGKFRKAFDYFLKVHEEAIRYENTYLLYASKKNIGILKSILGENESALVTLRECYQFYSENKDKVTNREYLEVLFALSESYNFNKVLDSASMINKIGYQESLKAEDQKYLSFFTLNEGINQYGKKNFTVAKDSLEHSITLLKAVKEKTNLGQAYFYLGKTLAQIGEQNQAIVEHQKADEIFIKSPQIIPESRENYEILLNHYKSIDDKDNQLKYIGKLLEVDSVLNNNYKYLIKNVVQNYDTPMLISEKQEIIDSLQSDKKSSFIIIAILGLMSIILAIFLVLNHRKNKKYKERFIALYNENQEYKRKTNIKTDVSKTEALGIAEGIVEGILNDLEEFEENLDFLEPNIVSNDLAKKMNTNSKYLSKVISHYKKRNFITYINELRINYCIEKLKTDKKFMNYTVKAIAREIGFNSVDAFSKSFFKIKGIQPSYFIRELEKTLQN